MVLLFYTTYISVDIAQYEIFSAKVDMGAISINTCTHCTCIQSVLEK